MSSRFDLEVTMQTVRPIAIALILFTPVACGLPAVAGPGTAPTAAGGAAQACGDWPRPVVCEVELRVNRGGWNWERLSLRDPLRVPPDASVEIEVAARDQWGRTFPPQRMILGYGSRDCGGVIDIDDLGEARLRLEGDAIGRQCRLGLFLPGNLNFEWELRIEVGREQGGGYSRDEAEAIANALYRGILGRDADAGSLGPAAVEVQRGRLEAQVEAMLGSGEFARSISGLTATAILERFYDGLLQRRPDSSAVRDLLPLLERRRYANVVLAIVRSPEFEQRVLGNR